MVIMGAGMGFVLVGVQDAANGGVPADKSGLAASLITASFQLGSALGLAIFVSLATSHTHHLLATHTQPPEALTLGFQRGLLGASIALVIAALVALRATNVLVVDMAPGAEEDMAQARKTTKPCQSPWLANRHKAPSVRDPLGSTSREQVDCDRSLETSWPPVVSGPAS
jgi:hypothetical protein